MRRVRARWVFVAMTAMGACALAGATGAGCSEAGDGNTGGGAAVTTNGSSSGATSTGSPASGPVGSAGSSGPTRGASSGAGTSTATSSSASSGVAPGATIVINEIEGKGGNWVELKNTGTTSADIGGYGLCDDVDPTKGHTCDMTNIVIFPNGTTLPPGGYLLVVGNEPSDAGVGPQVSCLPDGGPTTCFYATWKISSSSGEMVHLLDGSLKVVDEELYPMNAVPSGQTWGRLPDGTGAFAANEPTPGATNEAAQ